MTYLIVQSALWAFLIHPAPSWSEATPETLTTSKYSVNFRNADLHEAMGLVSRLSGLSYSAPDTLKLNISYKLEQTTLKSLLDKISQDNELIYSIRKGTIYLRKRSQEPFKDVKDMGIFRLRVRRTTPDKIISKLPDEIKTSGKIISDEGTNSIVFYGNKDEFDVLEKFTEALDFSPKQILIQAQIVETSKNLARDLGVRWGDLKNGSLNSTEDLPGNTTGQIITPTPGTPFLSLRQAIGSINGHLLEAQLAAAESAGEAKVISRPKVVTLNNERAMISSGIKFNVKTLSSVSGGSNDNEEAVTGGIQEIRAGLDLAVLPKVLGDNLIQLQIQISNSEPDHALSVDNIPGIVDNSANSSIIVKDGETLTLAGLVKNTAGSNRAGVPLLADIPVLGWLFKGMSNTERESELMIFITPSVID